jgi:hypothetical protein
MKKRIKVKPRRIKPVNIAGHEAKNRLKKKGAITYEHIRKMPT